MRTEWINNQTNKQNHSVIRPNDSIQVSFTNEQKRDKIIRHTKSKNINQRNSHGNTSSSYEIMQRCVHRVASIFVYSMQYRCVLSRLSSHTWTCIRSLYSCLQSHQMHLVNKHCCCMQITVATTCSITVALRLSSYSSINWRISI